MITAHHAQGINKNSSYTKHETIKGKKKKKKNRVKSYILPSLSALPLIADQKYSKD